MKTFALRSVNAIRALVPTMLLWLTCLMYLDLRLFASMVVTPRKLVHEVLKDKKKCAKERTLQIKRSDAERTIPDPDPDSIAGHGNRRVTWTIIQRGDRSEFLHHNDQESLP